MFNCSWGSKTVKTFHFHLRGKNGLRCIFHRVKPVSLFVEYFRFSSNISVRILSHITRRSDSIYCATTKWQVNDSGMKMRKENWLRHWIRRQCLLTMRMMYAVMLVHVFDN